jgi:tetratricopeptide (TPR) repeat protein
MGRSVTTLCLLALVTLVAAEAAAQSVREQARALLREGNQLYAEGKNSAALERFRRAYALYPSPKINYNFATVLQAMGRRVEAAVNFDRFLEKGAASASADMVREARRRLAVIGRKVGRLRIRCRTQAARLRVNGRSVGRCRDVRRRLYLAPGRAKVTASLAGHRPWSREVRLRRGQVRTIKVPALRRGAAPASAGPVDESTVALYRKKTLWFYGAAGAGAACGLVAVILYGVGVSQGNAAYDAYIATTDRAEIKKHRDEIGSAKGKVAGGHVLMALTAAAAGVAIYSLVTRPARPAASVSVTPAPGGVGLVIGGTF